MQALGLVWSDVDIVAADSNECPADIPEPAHFGAKLLRGHWEARAGRGGMLLGRDVPSRPLAPVLRNLVVYEPLPDDIDFRIRIAGAALFRRYGRDVTGMRLSGICSGERFRKRYFELKNVLRRGEPMSRDVKVLNGSRPPLHFETLDVPALASDGKSPMVLGGVFYHDWIH